MTGQNRSNKLHHGGDLKHNSTGLASLHLFLCQENSICHGLFHGILPHILWLSGITEHVIGVSDYVCLFGFRVVFVLMAGLLLQTGWVYEDMDLPLVELRHRSPLVNPNVLQKMQLTTGRPA